MNALTRLNLLFQEKQSRTLDALLVTPVNLSQIWKIRRTYNGS
jgi:ABC-type Na+ efflux pump permease subunit